MIEPYNPGRNFTINPPGQKTKVEKPTPESLAHGEAVSKIEEINQNRRNNAENREVWDELV